MENLYAGIYRRLKEKSSPVTDKIKLVKFAWKSERVYIPNKEQFILDLLCGLLLNKKRNNLTEDDANKIWKCLYEILNTRRIHHRSDQGQTIIVKPSICQVITDRLTAEVDIKDVNLEVVHHVLGCSYAILMSPSLSYVFATKFDHMINLLAVVTKLTVKFLLKEIDVTDEQIKLLKKCVDVYKISQRAHPNQKQVLQSLVDKVFLPAVVLRSITTQDESRTISGLQDCVDGLMTVLEDAVFNNDHDVSYDMYLSIVCGTGESSLPPPKVIENIFTLMSNCLTGKVTVSYIPSNVVQDCVIDYLPVFFGSFLCHDSHGKNNTIAHWLFCHICSLIGLKTDRTALCGPLQEPPALRVISNMLQIVQKSDVYSVTQDKALDNTQLKYYRHILDVLLKCKISPELYSCLLHLIELNHEILETKLVEVFQHCWLTVNLTSDALMVEAMDKFLMETVRTYSKLRQVGKWLDKVMSSISSSNIDGCWFFSATFSNSFREVVQALPQGTTVDLWMKFVQTLKDDYIPQLFYNDDSVWVRRLEDMVNLSHIYMMSVRVADYSITDITSQRVRDIMDTIPTDIINPLVDICMQQKKNDLLYSILLLCHTWGEVKQLLALHVKYRASFKCAQPKVSHLSAVSLGHSYISEDIWTKIHNHIQKTHDYRTLYLWDKLLVQALRFALYQLAIDEKKNDRVIELLFENLLQLPSDITAETMAATWDKLLNVTSNNYLIAKWDLLTQSLPFLVAIVTEAQSKTIAEFIVKILTHNKFSKTIVTVSSSHNEENTVTMETITSDFLKSSMVKELPWLHASLITSVFASIRERIVPKMKSPKKRRSSRMLELILTNLDLLSDGEINWNSDIDSDKLKYLQDLGGKMKEMMLCDEVPVGFSVPDLSPYFDIFSCLPLSHITSTDKLRCFYGFITVLHISLYQSGSGNKQTTESKSDGAPTISLEAFRVERDPSSFVDDLRFREPITSSLDLLTVLLESIGLTPVFQLLDISTYWTLISSMYANVQGESVAMEKIHLLTEVSWHCVFKDFRVVLNMSECVLMLKKKLLTVNSGIKQPELTESSQVTAYLRISASLLEELDKMIGRPYLKEEVKDICKSYFQEISIGVSHVISSLRKSDLPCPSPLVRAFSRIVFQIADNEMVQEKKWKKNFDFILSVCTTWLKNTQLDRNMVATADSLSFLNSVFKNHQGLKPLLSAEIRTDIWIILTDLLSKLLTSGARNKDQQRTATSKPDTIRKINVILSGESHSHAAEETTNDNKKSGIKKFKSDNSSSSVGREILEVDNSVDFFDTFSNHKQLEQTLIYRGLIKMERSKVILVQVQEVIGSLIASCGIEQFKQILNTLVENISAENFTGNPQKLRSYVYLWKHLLKYELSDEQYGILGHAVQLVMLKFQSIIQLLRDMDDDVVVCDIAVPILHVQVQMLQYGPQLISPQTAILSLHSCQFMPLGGSMYIPAFHAIYEVVNALLVHHTNKVLEVIPAFLGSAKRLLLSVISEGSQDKLSSSPEHAQEVVICAQFVDRLFMLLTTYKVEFCKVASYVIADYVTEVQKVTLLPAVKKALVPVVNKLLDICDKHSIAQLHTVLNLGVKEVFKLLYSDYTKYQKYTGKV